MNSRSFNYLLLLILVIATLLRTWHLWDIPFMHDELSTLARAGYGTFCELIEKGVKGDYHPAGLQIFVWLWIKMIGISEVAVKLPFILCGIGSVFMAYLIAKKWFGETTAFFTATYMATLQYTIIYGSLIARMYPLALFFSLVMGYCWTKMEAEENFSFKNTILFILSAIFCTHLHHFAMLFVGIVCFSGIFLIKRIYLKKYFLCLLLILIAYLPNIPLLLAQLKEGGADWMGVISLDFFRYYFSYLCHFSLLVAILTVGMFISSIYIARKNLSFNKYHILSLTWFFSPLVLGYVYSVLHAPVLQNYVLLFSFHYLLFFLFSFCQNWNKLVQTLLVLIICIVNISTLILKREHFKTFYHQPFQDIHHYAYQARQEYGQQVRIIHGINPRYYAYYDTVQPTQTIFLNDYATDIETWRTKIAQDTASYLLLGEVPLPYYLTAKEYFPTEISRNIGFTYETHLLSKKPQASKELIIYKEPNGNNSPLIISFSKEIPYNAVFQADLTFPPDSNNKTYPVIFKVIQKDKTLFEQKKNLTIPPHTQPTHYYLTERLRHIFTYTQNRDNCQLILVSPTQGKLQIVEGNPYIYGMSYEIE